MQTSFASPRLVSSNPFASFDTGSFYPSNLGGGSGSSNDDSSDPWAAASSASFSSTPTPAPIASTSTSSSPFDSSLPLPDIYEQAYRAVTASSSSSSLQNTSGFGYGASNTGSVSFTALSKTLSSAAGLSPSDTEKIINLISNTGNSDFSSSHSLYSSAEGSPFSSPSRTGGNSTTSSSFTRISKQDFYLALGLAGLAQERKPISVQALSARKLLPPIPKLDLSVFSSASNQSPSRPFPSSTSSTSVNGNSAGQQVTSSGFSSSPTSPLRSTKVSFGSTTDPWRTGSGMNSNSQHPGSPSRSNTYGSNGGAFTNGFSSSSSAHQGNTSYPSFSDDPTTTDNAIPQSQSGLPPYPGALPYISLTDRISVVQLNELGGTWINRWTIYQVTSAKRGTKVERRFSDWLWLTEILAKKYQARILLGLPPKRVGISARHIQIANDDQFLERRRKALARFLNFVVNHHVYKNERLVNVFLNEPMDLVTWRKNNPDHLTFVPEDQSTKLTEAQLSSIPTTLDTTLTTLRDALPGIIEAQTKLCSYLERIYSRTLANAHDWVRLKLVWDGFGESYSSLCTTGGGRPKEIEEDSTLFARDSSRFSSSTLSSLAEVLESSSSSFQAGLLEEFKSIREIYRAFSQLLIRYESKLVLDSIDKLKRRIETSQAKYQTLSSAKKVGWEAECQKVLTSIEQDQASIESELRRKEYVKYAMAQEVRWLWRIQTSRGRVALSEWSKLESGTSLRVREVWERIERELDLTE